MIRGVASTGGQAADGRQPASPSDVAGQADAFSAFFEAHARSLHRYLCARAGRDIADDLVSDTFLIAFRQRDSFDTTRGTGQAWLFGIATNLLRHHRRSQLRHLAATARLAGQAAHTTDDDRADHRLDAATSIRRLVPDLSRLNSVDLDILLLNAWAGLEPTEIGAALGMPASTVRSRLRRTRRTLRAASGPLGATVIDSSGANHEE